MTQEITIMTKSCARDLTDRINSTCDDLAGMLKRMHDEKGWAALGYDTWKDYVSSELKFSERRSFQLIQFAEIKENIADSQRKSLNISKTTELKFSPPTIQTEIQARPLGTLEPEKQQEAWKEAVTAAGGEQPTAKQVTAAVEKVRAASPKLETEPEDKEYTDAIKKIGKMFGAGTVKGINEGVYSFPKHDILNLVRLNDENMKEVGTLMFESRWPLKKAIGFLNKMPHEDTKVWQLKHHCIAAGGTWDCTIDGFKITVEHLTRKY